MEQNIKQAIIEQKINQWQQQQYSLELDVKVAKVVDDSAMLERVKTQLKTAIGALEVLADELKELETNETETDNT